MSASNRSDPIQIRRTGDEVEKLLARLDAGHNAGAAKRKDERFVYRSTLVVTELMDASGSWSKFRTPSRNISDNGVSVLIGKFVYPHTRCRVHLVTVNNRFQAVDGEVRFCRYLSESATVHEIGIRFDATIDIELFHREATKYRLLLVDDDDAIHQLVPRMLANKLNTEIVSARDGEEAMEKAFGQDFDVVLLDLDMPKKDGMGVIKTLREKGYWRPIVALTARSQPEEIQACMDAGFSAVLNKPFTRLDLHDILVAQKDQPILSTMCDQEDMVELIDQFVGSLPETIAVLEESSRTGQNDMLSAVARRLKGDAGTYGFGPITSAAADVEQLLCSESDEIAVREGLNRLIRMCAAARKVRGRAGRGADEAAEPAAQAK